MNRIVVVDYGMGNIKSVIRGIEHVGATAVLSEDPNDVRKADRVILPGVGAFEDGMKELQRRKLDVALLDYIQTERPLLGICLGMQMLFDESDEHGKHKGLGFIKGRVIKIPQDNNGNTKRKIPHIGWSALRFPHYHQDQSETVLDSTSEGDFLYFVHSFMAKPDNNKHILAECEYENLSITAFVRKNNISGCQFHPEKSGTTGLKMFDRFLTL